MKYLQRYKEEHQFNEVYYDDNKYFEPWLSFTDEIERVDYNKNIGGDCLTFEILSSGTIYLGELLLEKLNTDLFSETYTDMDFSSVEELPPSDYILHQNVYGGVIMKSPRKSSSNVSFKNFYDKFKTLPPVKYKLNDNDWVDWEYDEENYYRKLDVVAGDIIKFKGDTSYPSVTYNNYNFDIPENIGSPVRYATLTGNIVEEEISMDLIYMLNHVNLDFDLKFIEIEPIDISGIDVNFIQYYLLNREAFYNDTYADFKEYGEKDGYYGGISANNAKLNWFISPISKRAGNRTIYKKDTSNPNIKALCYGIQQTAYYGYEEYSGFSEIVIGFLKFDNSENLIGFTHILPSNNSAYSFSSSYSPTSMVGTNYNYETGKYDIFYAAFTDYIEDIDIENEIITPGQQLLLFFDNKDYYVDFMYKYAFNNDPKSSLLNTSIYNFQSSNGCRFKVSENLCSLYYGESYETKKLALYKYQYAGIFYNCEGLVSCKDLMFYPSLLSPYCYFGLFANCTNLVEIPESLSEDVQLEEFCYAFMFYGCTSLTYTPELLNKNLMPCCYFGMFRKCTSLSEINKIAASEIPQYTFAFTFSKCDSLEAIPDLEFVYLGTGAMTCMFANCSGLTELGDFNFVVTGYGAFQGMFTKCQNLISIGNLTFDSMSNFCCSHMFMSCPNLTTVGDIISTVDLESFCYYYMFYKCSSLINVGEIFAPTLAAYCCANMFNSCTSMVTPPELTSTTTAVGCYLSMFYNCTSLLRTPELPATRSLEYNGSSNYDNGYGYASVSSVGRLMSTKATRGEITLNDDSSFSGLADSCYEQMFMNCTSLNQIIELPAKHVGRYSYKEMFRGCTSLVTGPIIDGIWLEDYCFAGMFYGCTSLTNASELKCNGKLNLKFITGYGDIFEYIEENYDTETDGALLGSYQFESMFGECTSLVTAPQLKSLFLSEYCYDNMFNGCISLTTIPEITILFSHSYTFNGTFANCTSLTNTAIIKNKIYPTGFDIDSFMNQIKDPDYFESNDWQNWFNNGCDMDNMPVPEGVYVSDIYHYISSYNDGYTYCYSSIYNYMYNNCTSLTTINKIDNISEKFINYTFQNTFIKCSSLVTIPQWLFEEYKGVQGCFRNTFEKCTSLRNIPTITAEELPDQYFYSTFYECTGLVTAPNIESTNFNTYSCCNMFYGCTSLVTAPQTLNIVTLPNGNYYAYVFDAMFFGCTSLTKSPKIICNLEINSAYLFQSMFRNCISLNEIYFDMPNNTSTSQISNNWVDNVSQHGTFKMRYGKTYQIGQNGIPVGWNIDYIDDFVVTLSKNELLKKDTLTVTGYSQTDLTITTNVSLQNNSWLSISKTVLPTGHFEFTINTNITNEDLDETISLIVYFNSNNVPIANETVLIYSNVVENYNMYTVNGTWSTNRRTLDGKTICSVTNGTSASKYRWVTRLVVSGCQKVTLRVAIYQNSYLDFGLVISKPDMDITNEENILVGNSKVLWYSNNTSVGIRNEKWITVTINLNSVTEHTIYIVHTKETSDIASSDTFRASFYVKNTE